MLPLPVSQKVSEEAGKVSRQRQVAEAIRHKCQQAQRELAFYLQKRSERLSRMGKQWFLVLFCAGGSIVYTYTVLQGLNAPKPLHSSLMQIRFPLHTMADKRQSGSQQEVTDDPIRQRIKGFHQYMDSLSLSNSGRLIRDSILAVRPGLMDSIAQIEKTYLDKQNQIK